MTTNKLKNNENFNTLEGNVKDNNISLTEEWRKGELDEGFYYFKLPNGNKGIGSDYTLARYKLTKDSDKIEILARVPDYIEWRNYITSFYYEHEYNSKLQEKNKKLKDLLKRCRIILDDEGYYTTVCEIDEVLK
jgi:hypothetical protein